MGSLDAALQAFCGKGRKEIDARGFVTLCKGSGIIDEEFTASNAEAVFLKVVPLARRRIDMPRLRQALHLVAERKGLDDAVVLNMVAIAGASSGGDASEAAAAGPRTAHRASGERRGRSSTPAEPPQMPPSPSASRQRVSSKGIGASGAASAGSSVAAPPQTRQHQQSTKTRGGESLDRQRGPVDPMEAQAQQLQVPRQPSVNGLRASSSCPSVREPRETSEAPRSPSGVTLGTSSSCPSLREQNDPSKGAPTSPAGKPRRPKSASRSGGGGRATATTSPEPPQAPRAPPAPMEAAVAPGAPAPPAPQQSQALGGRRHVSHLPSNGSTLYARRRPRSPSAARRDRAVAAAATAADGGSAASGCESEPEERTGKLAPQASRRSLVYHSPSTSPASVMRIARPRGRTDETNEAVNNTQDENAAEPGNGVITVQDTFNLFCGNRPGLDSKGFAKLCKKCCLLDQKFTSQDAQIVFSGVVPLGQERMGMESFKAALRQLALKKGLEEALVQRMVSWYRPPESCNGEEKTWPTTKASSFTEKQVSAAGHYEEGASPQRHRHAARRTGSTPCFRDPSSPPAGSGANMIRGLIENSIEEDKPSTPTETDPASASPLPSTRMWTSMPLTPARRPQSSSTPTRRSLEDGDDPRRSPEEGSGRRRSKSGEKMLQPPQASRGGGTHMISMPLTAARRAKSMSVRQEPPAAEGGCEAAEAKGARDEADGVVEEQQTSLRRNLFTSMPLNPVVSWRQPANMVSVC